ncbi:MAG: hypothetical protein ACQESH_01550 [Campylobacterota bacterium]
MHELSFITPKKRSFFDVESKILFAFLIVIALIIIGFSIFLYVQGFSKSTQVKSMDEQMIVMGQEMIAYEYEIEQIRELEKKADEVYTTNELLKESIKNLFALIPDQITLTQSVMEKDRLVLYGITPSKEVYNFMLLSPLKSIFHENRTTFYSLENGWYRFVSVNVLEDERGLVQ